MPGSAIHIFLINVARQGYSLLVVNPEGQVLERNLSVESDYVSSSYLRLQERLISTVKAGRGAWSVASRHDVGVPGPVIGYACRLMLPDEDDRMGISFVHAMQVLDPNDLYRYARATVESLSALGIDRIYSVVASVAVGELAASEELKSLVGGIEHSVRSYPDTDDAQSTGHIETAVETIYHNCAGAAAAAWLTAAHQQTGAPPPWEVFDDVAGEGNTKTIIYSPARPQKDIIRASEILHNGVSFFRNALRRRAHGEGGLQATADSRPRTQTEQPHPPQEKQRPESRALPPTQPDSAMASEEEEPSAKNLTEKKPEAHNTSSRNLSIFVLAGMGLLILIVLMLQLEMRIRLGTLLPDTNISATRGSAYASETKQTASANTPQAETAKPPQPTLPRIKLKHIEDLLASVSAVAQKGAVERRDVWQVRATIADKKALVARTADTLLRVSKDDNIEAAFEDPVKAYRELDSLCVELLKTIDSLLAQKANSKPIIEGVKSKLESAKASIQ